MTYRDIIEYELAEGVTQDELLAIAQDIYTNWMMHQEGFLGWEIHLCGDGSFVDTVSWNSKEDAKKAEQNMGTIQNGDKWFACYKPGSIKSRHATILFSKEKKENLQ